MDFPIDVKPGDRFQISVRNYTKEFIVQPHPLDSSDPYFELGGTGAVLQLREENSNIPHALKIFSSDYQDEAESQVSYADNLIKLRLNNVLSVADRVVLTPQNNSKLLARYEPLKYSLLMRWIPGYTWQEVLIDNKTSKKKPVFSPQQSFEVAANLCVALKLIEDANCAHCDVCSNNVIVDPKTNKVELIDIEDMYGPGFTKSPSFIGGQNGYTHQKHNQGHQWCQESDRFGGAILMTEMMTWYSPSVKDLSGSESYFPANDELHKKGTAFHTILNVLKEQTSSKVVELFVATWESANFRECPPISAWYQELAKVANEKNIAIEGLLVGASKPSEPLVKSRRTITLNTTSDVNSDDTTVIPQDTTIAKRRKIDFGDSRDQSSATNTAQSPSGSIVGRRQIHTDDVNTPKQPSNSKKSGDVTPRSPSTSSSASSPKPRVTPTPSPKDTDPDSKSTNADSEILSNIFWTIVFIAVVVVVINLVFPDLFPSIIQLIQRIADSIAP